jgi:hypothetical protein
MRWWRRESTIRLDLQRCQSRLRLARLALGAFRQGFLGLAMDMPIVEVAPIIAQLDRIDIILGGDEEGPR